MKKILLVLFATGALLCASVNLATPHVTVAEEAGIGGWPPPDAKECAREWYPGCPIDLAKHKPPMQLSLLSPVQMFSLALSSKSKGETQFCKGCPNPPWPARPCDDCPDWPENVSPVKNMTYPQWYALHNPNPNPK